MASRATGAIKQEAKEQQQSQSKTGSQITNQNRADAAKWRIGGQELIIFRKEEGTRSLSGRIWQCLAATVVEGREYPWCLKGACQR